MFGVCIVFSLHLISVFPGWLHKEVKNSPKTSSLKLKKRWFVLTHNSLDYYKSSEKNAMKLGTLVLNSLCSVVPPDEKIFKETGDWCSVLMTSWAHHPASAERSGFAHTRGTRFLRRACTSSPPVKLLLIYLGGLSGVSYRCTCI